MPLLKSCQPRLGWVTAVLYAASMKGLMDVGMMAKTSLAGTCHGRGPEHAQSLTRWVWVVSPQISPSGCKVCKRQMRDLI